MTKRSILPQSRHHIYLYDEDWQWLEQNYGEAIGVSRVIRQMVHDFCTKQREAVNLRLSRERGASANGEQVK